MTDSIVTRIGQRVSVYTRSIVEPVRKYCKRTSSRAVFYEATCEDIDFNSRTLLCRGTKTILESIYYNNVYYILIGDTVRLD